MDAELPAAHFVSSTDTMSQIFTLPYMDSEVSIVLHRVGGMLVMEGTLNGSDLGSGNVDGRVGGGKGGAGMMDADELASNFMYFSSGSDAAAPSGDGHTLHSAGAHSTQRYKPSARGSASRRHRAAFVSTPAAMRPSSRSAPARARFPHTAVTGTRG